MHYYAKYLAPDRIRNEPTPAMIMGSAVHSAVLEPDLFPTEYVMGPQGLNMRTNAGKAEFAAFEAASQLRGLQDQLLNGVAILLCAGIGLWALRRYLRLLNHAECVANQADCPHCKAYGRLEVIGSDATGDEVDVEGKVTCAGIIRDHGFG